MGHKGLPSKFVPVYLPDLTEAFCTAGQSASHAKDAQSVLGTDRLSKVIMTTTVVAASGWRVPLCNGDTGKRASHFQSADNHQA